MSVMVIQSYALLTVRSKFAAVRISMTVCCLSKTEGATDGDSVGDDVGAEVGFDVG